MSALSIHQQLAAASQRQCHRPHPPTVASGGPAAFALSLLAIAALQLAFALSTASAENVDLSTVPTRASVQLTIYNSEDLTLVRETRVVTFKKGLNTLQFSWANTLIDPSSVELKFLTSSDKIVVLDTTFPHAKPQMLYWNVQSDIDAEATLQITYFTSGISWSADYVCIAAATEKTMEMEGFVRINNNSGEEYEDAQVRLVVGTINLVEKIAQLAQVPMADVGKMKKDELAGYRWQAAQLAMPSGLGGGMAESDASSVNAKEIIKEGLSEYFIYTVEGKETVNNGWSKRIRSFHGKNVPVKVEYRFRPQEYGEQLVRLYTLKNNEEHELGTTPLPDGTVRVFRDNGREGLSYLATQAIKYVPIGDDIDLNLGVDPEVIMELIKQRVRRDNLWLQIHGTNEYRKIGGDGSIKQENATLVGWADREIYAQRIRNYTGKEIHVEVRRAWPGHVAFRSALNPKLHDFQTVELTASVASGKKVDLQFEIVRQQGINAKQSNVTLEEGTIGR